MSAPSSTPSESLVSSRSALVLGRLDDAWRMLEPEIQRPVAVTTIHLIAFVESEAPYLDAGTPDADSSGRFYAAMQGICAELAVPMADPTARAQALSFIVARLRDALEGCGPAYDAWLASLSSTGYIVYRTNERTSTKTEI